MTHSFTVKDGVILTNVHPKMLEAWPVVARVYAAMGFDTTITSGRDGKHMEGSLHYAELMRATDFRTWADKKGTQMSDSMKETLKKEVQRELDDVFGPDQFDVVLSPINLHVEFDPPELKGKG